MPTLSAAQLQKARQQQAETMQMNSREIGQQRMFAALLHVYRFGWSSPSLIDRWHGSGTHRGLCAKLVKKGLLRETKTISAGLGLIGTPAKFVTLTKAGLDSVESYPDFNAEKYLRDNYQLSPSKYNQNKFRHDHIIQQLTMRYLLNNDNRIYYGFDVEDYCTENEFNSKKDKEKKKSNSDKKQFDVIWEMPAGINAHGEEYPEWKGGVEVELSQKSGLKLDLFACKIAKAISDGEVDFVAIFSESEYLLTKYKEKFKAGSEIKSPNGNTIKIPDYLFDKVVACKITEAMLKESRPKTNWLEIAKENEPERSKLTPERQKELKKLLQRFD